VLDKNISGTNGLDVCRFIRDTASYKQIPVIILSASPDVVSQGIEAGADNVITKPFSLKKLRKTIFKCTAR